MRILTSGAMKMAESIAVEKGSSYLQLMENAGKGAAEQLMSLAEVARRRVLILCGKGNNGGDGLVVARYLEQVDAEVTVVFLCGRELSALSRANLFELEKLRVRVTDLDLPVEKLRDLLERADLLVDAVFGTGFSGDLQEEVRAVFRRANACNAIKIALDLPSGVDADTGFFDKDAFCADYTYTFGAYKPAHFLKSSMPLCGLISLVDIGIQVADIHSLAEGITPLSKEIAADCLPKRRPDSHKGDYGKLLNIGGCVSMSGAVQLSSMAALRSGLGLLKVAAPETLLPILAGRIPEILHAPLPVAASGSVSLDGVGRLQTELKWATAVLLGCGLAVTEDTRLLVEDVLLSSTVPVVLDADGLNCLVGQVELLHKVKAPMILTPHLMEMSRLTGHSIEVIKSRRFDIAAQFARTYQVTLVLKDSSTVIATPSGELYMSLNGNAGLAKGGSGDVLAGLIAGFLAQGVSPLYAALSGVYYHAAAGDSAKEVLGERGMLPSDVVNDIPFVLR